MIFDKLDYYILGEMITVLFSGILLYNVFTSFSPYERKHRLFLYAVFGCFCAAAFDVVSVFCTSYYSVVNPALSLIIQSLFYASLIFIPLCLTGYSLELAFSGRTTIAHHITMIVYLLYLILLLVNLKTGWIFHIDQINGYQKGPLKNITYILSVFYMIIIEVTLISHRKHLAKRLCITMMLYPVIGISILCIQFVLPKVLLTGTSSLAALLLCYLTIQSDMLDFDLVTGLMSQHKLEKHIQLKNTKGVLFVLSIENISIYQNNLSSTDFNSLLLLIGRKFQRTFDYGYFTVNSFAAIVNTEEELEEKYESLKVFFDELYASGQLKVPVPVEYYGAAVAFGKGEKNYSTVKTIINNLLLKAKVKGKKTLQICDDSVLADLERQNKIYEILKRELRLDSNQFNINYQPIYSVSDGRFMYMEALSRLTGTEMGDISPAEFVVVAEKKGLIEKLGNVAFEKICKFISDNRGVVNAVSINFSVYQMTNPGIVNHVLDTIAKFGLDPSNIIMEITESIFIENFELVAKNMTDLAQAGVKFYLDDFGNGYSNLANVVGLPFSTVKMDRSLVLAMENSTKNYDLFANLVSTFKGAGLKVLVEGVETENQDEQVKNAGVDYIQGFLYSRPVSEDSCLELLRK